MNWETTMNKYSNVSQMTDDIIDNLFGIYEGGDYTGDYQTYVIYHTLQYRIRGEEYLTWAIDKTKRFYPEFEYVNQDKRSVFFNFKKEHLEAVGI